MTISAGEISLADRGDRTCCQVFAVSDSRFYRLAERAVVAPVLDGVPDCPSPWHIVFADRAVAVNQLGTTPIGRLVERAETARNDTLRQVRRAVMEITS